MRQRSLRRRSFLLAATGAGLAGGGMIARGPAWTPRSFPPVRDDRFPKGFVWGTSTSSYQIEGAVSAAGRGASIWDTFARVPGKIAAGDTGEVACDHYHRYREDVALMEGLGLSAYRFSIAWPRIFPEGTGQADPAGLDFYDRLTDAVLEAGIAPWPCLYHWDLPQALQDRGGWLNRDIADWFADYAAVVVSRLCDRVRTWVTLNEPSVVAIFGHCLGRHAPGLMGEKNFYPVAHHQNLAHGRAVEVIRAAGGPDGRIGTALSLVPMRESASALSSSSSANRAATAMMDALWNRCFLDPLLSDGYPQLLQDRIAPWIKDGDLDMVRRPIDFVGLNYYAPAYIQAEPGGLFGLGYGLPPEGTPCTGMGWPIEPAALYDQLIEVRDHYANIPIVITENGAGYEEGPGTGDRVEDDDRIAYLHSHLAACRAAIAAGCNLQGYFIWTLLDNFEWAEGYAKRFGLLAVDRATLARRPKKSSGWFRDVVRSNRLSPPVSSPPSSRRI